MTNKEAEENLNAVEKIASHTKNHFKNAPEYGVINDVVSDLITRMYHEAQVVADFTLFKEEEPKE